MEELWAGVSALALPGRAMTLAQAAAATRVRPPLRAVVARLVRDGDTAVFCMVFYDLDRLAAAPLAHALLGDSDLHREKRVCAKARRCIGHRRAAPRFRRGQTFTGLQLGCPVHGPVSIRRGGLPRRQAQFLAAHSERDKPRISYGFS